LGRAVSSGRARNKRWIAMDEKRQLQTPLIQVERVA
jgi:hypothetical protein